MEDDDEIHSHPSRSGSHDSHRSNRRISVTVASAAPPQNTLTLALPMQQPRSVGGGGGGGREDCWSEGATGVLIDAWGERYLELSRGNLKQKHWKEVAYIVSSREDYMKVPKTDIQCKNRIDTVKKKYKLEKSKIMAGGGPSTWRFYDQLDHLIGPTAAAKSGGPSSATPPLRAVPVGIPVGVRSAPVHSLRLKQQQERQQQLHLQQQQLHQQQQLQQQQMLNLRKRMRPPPAYSDSSESEPEQSPDSPESDPYEQKRIRLPYNAPRQQHQQQDKGRGSKEKNWGDSVRELTKAIMKFGEAYEQAESAKLQQMVEMQKQSMKFAKELELQRMQFFMKTQLELSQLKQSRRGGVGNNNNNHHNNHSHNHNHNHHSGNHNTINNNNHNHSDDSNN